MTRHLRATRVLVVCTALCVLVVAAALALPACGGSAGGSQESAAGGATPVASAHASAAPRLTGGGLPPGCRCHSKVKWQVAMHKLFGPADCEKCHSADEDLMAAQGTQMTAAHLAELKDRMSSEQVCRQCHKKDGTSVPARLSAMQGGLYCPKDGKLYARGDALARGNAYVCPDDGTKLVDVDAVTAASEKKPSNAYCVACHQKTPGLEKKHAGVARAAGVADLSDCLSCHPGHSDCGSCHH